MKRTRKTEHPIAAAQRIGEQFHRWQGAGLKKAVRLVMRNPAPESWRVDYYRLGTTGRVVATKTFKTRDGASNTAKRDVDRGWIWDDDATVDVGSAVVREGGSKRNPAGWQQAEASATVRRATQTGTLADRQAAHAALAKVAARRRPSPLPNPAKDAGAKAYRAAVLASRKASERRYNLPAGSSRAAVTTANARWKSAAEERDRLGGELPAAVRAAVDAELAALANPSRNPAIRHDLFEFDRRGFASFCSRATRAEVADALRQVEAQIATMAPGTSARAGAYSVRDALGNWLR